MPDVGGRHRQPHAGFAFLLDYVPNWKWAYGRRPTTPYCRGSVSSIRPAVSPPPACSLMTSSGLRRRSAVHPPGLKPPVRRRGGGESRAPHPASDCGPQNHPNQESLQRPLFAAFPMPPYDPPMLAPRLATPAPPHPGSIATRATQAARNPAGLAPAATPAAASPGWQAPAATQLATLPSYGPTGRARPPSFPR